MKRGEFYMVKLRHKLAADSCFRRLQPPHAPHFSRQQAEQSCRCLSYIQSGYVAFRVYLPDGKVQRAVLLTWRTNGLRKEGINKRNSAQVQQTLHCQRDVPEHSTFSPIPQQAPTGLQVTPWEATWHTLTAFLQTQPNNLCPSFIMQISVPSLSRLLHLWATVSPVKWDMQKAEGLSQNTAWLWWPWFCCETTLAMGQTH